MSMDLAAGSLPDTRPLYRLIRRTRALLRSSWAVTGLGLATGLFLSAALATGLLDLLVPLPTGLRLAALLLVVIPAGAALVVGVLLPLCRRLSNVQVARRIEQHLPGIHNRLVSAIDLQSHAPAKAASQAFYRRLFNEALERVRAFRPLRVVDLLRLRRASAFALGGAAGFAIAWLLFGDRLPTALARIGMPFADIPPASGVTYDVEPGNADALREELVTFTAHVTSTKQPDRLELEAIGDGGIKAPPVSMTRSDKDPALWTCQVDGASLGDAFKDGFRYRVRGGGTWSKKYRLRLVERPVILSIQTAVHYPAYMGIDKPRLNPPQATEVTGPEGGEAEVIVQSQGEVARGEVQLLVPGKRKIPPADQVERTWFEGKLPVAVSSDGTWNWQTRDNVNAHTEPAALGTHGHWFQGDPAGHLVQSGDVLYAHLYLSAKDPPQAILLQWHDGSGWEHGAYWGADLIREGRANTPSRRHVGPLPQTGRWVRLEVPATQVGLEGKTLRGMAFKLHDGQCFWGAVGTVRTEEPALLVTRSFPMKQIGENQWSGRFPLTGKGLFRPELRNSAGHTSKDKEKRAETRYIALPDQAPQVVLERPGSDVVLSKAAVIPLTIAAYDDYGLKEVNLLFRTSETGPYQTRTLEKYAAPRRSHTFVAPLKEAATLPAGGQLRYLIEAKDRKEQASRTREFVLRVAADPNAADRQFEVFDKSQDPFQDRLVKLIAEQKKIQTTVEKLEKQYAATLDKVCAAEAKAQTGNVGSPRPDPSKPQPPAKVDAETAKQLAALQAELAKLAQQQKQNADAAGQLSTDLARSTEQARNLQMLPPELAAQMQAAQQAFQQKGVQPLQDLAGMMQRGADPKQGTPDLKGIGQKSDKTSQNLEGIKKMLDALAKARKGLRDDLAKALRDLQKAMLNETGGLTARELKELRDYLARMAQQLKDLQGKQEDLFNKTPGAKDIARAEQDQANIEKALEKALADAKNLLASAKKRKPRRKPPEFPDSPYTPEGQEEKVPPKEEDGNDPLPGQKDKKDPKGKPDPKGNKKSDKKEDEEDEPLYMPALGGKKPVIDKRFAKKRRPVKRKPGDPKSDAESRRQDLENRQAEAMRDLQAAQQSLSSDQQTLSQMLRQLQQAMQGNSQQQGEPGQSDQAMDLLRQMLQSPQMRQALGMARRMRQGPPQGQQANGPRPPPLPGQTPGNLDGSPATGSATGELAKLDPATRAVILKLPPRVREELLQGMREQGPEGYGPFIEEYFKRLTETNR
jgi:hypothetical protein